MRRISDADVLPKFRRAAITADLVSFDLFDTLIRRDVWRPEDIFALVARRLPPPEAAWFQAHRAAAESAARRAAASREITLAAIYHQLRQPLTATPGVTPDLAAIMALEIAIEHQAIAPDPAACAIFHDLVAHGAKIVLVSDMYLPRPAIEAMLHRAALTGHAALYLSSETGLTKAAGTVWPQIRADHHLAPDATIVHLGDNPAADGTVAARHGITPFLLPPPDHAPPHRYQPSVHPITGICHALLRQALSATPSADAYWLTLAYLVVAPAAIGMAGWIADIARRQRRQVVFLARDGQIFRTAYQHAWRRPDEPSAGYLWSSRRCLNIAAIEDLTEPDLDFLCSGSTPMPPADYLRRIALDPATPAIAAVLAHWFPDPAAIVTGAEGKARLRAVFTALAAPIAARAAIERAALQTHLDRIGLFAGDALVVDLGWHGSLQASLNRLGKIATGSTPGLAGGYLGITKPQPALHGWLFEGADPPAAMAATVGLSYEVIELLFSAPSAGISHVELIGGEPQPVHHDQPEEAPRLALAALFHQAVEHVAKAMQPHLSPDDTQTLRGMAMTNLTALLGAPDAIDAAKFGQVPHAEGFGIASYRPIVPPNPGFQHPRALERAYNATFWRRGFLAGLDPAASLTLRAIHLYRRVSRHVSWRVSRHASWRLYRLSARTSPPAQISAPPATIEPSGRTP